MTTALTIIQLKTTIITDDDNGAVFLSVLLSSISRIISFLDQFTEIILQLIYGPVAEIVIQMEFIPTLGMGVEICWHWNTFHWWSRALHLPACPGVGIIWNVLGHKFNLTHLLGIVSSYQHCDGPHTLQPGLWHTPFVSLSQEFITQWNKASVVTTDDNYCVASVK